MVNPLNYNCIWIFQYLSSSHFFQIPPLPHYVNNVFVCFIQKRFLITSWRICHCETSWWNILRFLNDSYLWLGNIQSRIGVRETCLLNPILTNWNLLRCCYVLTWLLNATRFSPLIWTVLLSQNKIHSNQLKRTEAHINSQRDHQQELTSLNQDLCSQLQQSRQQFSAVQYKVTPHLTSSAIWQSGGV